MNNILDIKTPAEPQASELRSDFGLENHGLTNLRKAYWNLPGEALYEEVIFRKKDGSQFWGLMSLIAQKDDDATCYVQNIPPATLLINNFFMRKTQMAQNLYTDSRHAVQASCIRNRPSPCQYHAGIGFPLVNIG